MSQGFTSGEGTALPHPCLLDMPVALVPYALELFQIMRSDSAMDDIEDEKIWDLICGASFRRILVNYANGREPGLHERLPPLSRQ